MEKKFTNQLKLSPTYFFLLIFLFALNNLEAQFSQVAGGNGLNESSTGALNGQAWGDLNNDGNLDVIIHHGNSGNYTEGRLYLNTGAPNYEFRDTTDFLISGFTDQQFFGRQMLIADLNNDGYNDILRGFGGNRDTEIYFNDGPPNYTFGDATQQPDVFIPAPAVGTHNTEGVVAIDWNQDGWLDLIIDNDDGGNDVYENDQAGGFTYITAGSGVGETGFPSGHAGDGDYMTAADINDDGYVDIYGRKTDVSNFWQFNPTTSQFETQPNPNAISNEGDKGGTMFCDLDNDGDLDLFWTSNGTNQIWRNDGGGNWVATGIPAAPIANQTNIDGCDCGDVDNDGDLDIIMGSETTNSYLLENTTVGGVLSFSTTNINTGGANTESTTFADYDNDGDLDLYFVVRDGENQLWENNTNNTNYLYVNAMFNNSNGSSRDAIGANVILTTCEGDTTGMRQVNGGKGHGSQHQTKVHFGLDPNVSYIVEVHYVYNNGSRSIVKRAVVPANEANQEITILDTDGDDNSFCENEIGSTDDFGNTPYNTPISSDASTNDIDPESDNLTFALDGVNGGMDPADGTAVINPDGTYTYTPAVDFTGEVSFQYSVCDDGIPAKCDTSTVYIEVYGPVDPEVVTVIANPDANTVETGQTANGNVLSNDLDPDAIDPSVTTTLTSVTVNGVDDDGNPVADAGTLTLNSDGTYTFIPTGAFTGVVTQPYTICDGATPALACDDTELIITVLPDDGNSTFANDDANITDQGVSTSGNIITNDNDVEMDNQTVSSYLIDTDGDGDGDVAGVVGSATVVGGTDENGNYVANAGSLTLNSDGTYTFVPEANFVGNVVIPYTVCDDAATVACTEATLDITVLGVNRDYGDAPAIYPEAWHRSISDSDNDDILDGNTDVWLGSETTFEGQSAVDGDTEDDAMEFGSTSGQFPNDIVPGSTYPVDITLNSNSLDRVYYGMWIDWDGDGIYDSFYSGFEDINGSTAASIDVLAPGAIGSTVNVRLRVDNNPLASTDFEGGKSNGEVEDFSSAIALPIELVRFTVKAVSCDAQLNWTTSSEIGSSHFEIEKSIDGRNYGKIYSLDANHFSNNENHYQFVDLLANTASYYRLKMVDTDGSFEYSNVVSYRTECGIKDVKIFPNPVSADSEELVVSFVPEFRATSISIRDLLGRLVTTIQVETRPNEKNDLKIDLPKLSSGSYLLQFDGTNATEMFIIQE